ncbi:MAG: hypothetical protein QF805_23630, partial [Pirellulaceae bacterium]|nr:hypothetical protein [Pirellulaceae bacterium]
MPPRRQQTDPPGQDSFLDIVANLVGILIILVMIVGFRTRAAMEQTSIATVDVEDAPDVDAARRAASSIEADVHQVENKIKRQQMEVNYRRLERDKMLLAVTRMEADISDKRAALDDNRR